MRIFKQMADAISALRLRDQVIAIAAVAAVIGLTGNLLILKPQLLEVHRLQDMEASHQKELSLLKNAVIEIKKQEESGIDPFAAEKAEVEGYRRQIATTEKFMAQEGVSVAQLGTLVRTLISAQPGLVLTSLKTMPGSVFYTPPNASEKDNLKTEAQKVLSKMTKQEDKQEQAVVLIQRPIYKHGIEVALKGPYPALIGYLDGMQRFPGRIFWSEVSLDAKNHREATLRVLVYTLSDQPAASIN